VAEPFDNTAIPDRNRGQAPPATTGTGVIVVCGQKIASAAPPVSQISATARAGIVIISPAVAQPARVTANPGCALGCTPTALQGTGSDQAAFFLVRSLQTLQVLWLAGSGERGFTGAETGFEQEYG